MAIRMSPEVAEEVRGEFGEVRDTVVGADLATPGAVDGLLAALGEFAPDAQDGADTHRLGWRQLFGITATASRLVVTNVNELSVELTTLDEDAALGVPSPGRPGPI